MAVGGVAGATARWLVFTASTDHAFPWTLLVINIAGSFILGLVAFRTATGHRETLRLGVGVGFCGGLTTFSSFAVTAADLLRDERTGTAISFVAVSVALAIVALVAGSTARRHLDPEPAP